MGDNHEMVADCPADDCPLLPYRFGRHTKKNMGLTQLEAIKAECVRCACKIKSAVRGCSGKFCNGEYCTLHPYRLGHNPSRKGAGNKNAVIGA